MAIVIHETQRVKLSHSEKKRCRLVNLNKLIRDRNATCKSELRRRTFNILCKMVRDIGGLTGTRYISLEEIIAILLYTLVHQFKNMTVGSYLYRSRESVSRNFHRCLLAVLKLHTHLLKKHAPISKECENSRWKCFKVMQLLCLIPN